MVAIVMAGLTVAWSYSDRCFADKDVLFLIACISLKRRIVSLSAKSFCMLLPYLNKGLIEAGCDEAGRGCLAGSVYAAAVILPPDFKNELLNDSKQLTEKQRYLLREVVEKESIAWAVGVVTPQEIDKINILNASFLAMHRAVDQLNIRPEHLIIDGNRFKAYPSIPHTTVIKAMASIFLSQQPLFWQKHTVTIT
jgi:hypothetical protein